MREQVRLVTAVTNVRGEYMHTQLIRGEYMHTQLTRGGGDTQSPRGEYGALTKNVFAQLQVILVSGLSIS